MGLANPLRPAFRIQLYLRIARKPFTLSIIPELLLLIETDAQ